MFSIEFKPAIRLTGIARSEERPCIKIPLGPFFVYGSLVSGTVVTHVGAPYHCYYGSYVPDWTSTCSSTYSRFSVRVCHVNEQLGLEWRKNIKRGKWLPMKRLRHVRNRGCQS
ncbi:hypothetical protein TNCV_3289911 [Trichonephila clavipes]|nr:hypothetical protein TNCV_3289911 [Trichonephila clavipes]